MPLDDHTRTLLDARLAQGQRLGRVPSVVAGLLSDGDLVWTGAAGTLDGRPDGPTPQANTQYRIGSITKTFTAVLTLRLVQDGLVDLTDPVATHLPELADRLPGVRVSELLTHGSGLPAETDGAWWERSAGRTWQELLPSVRPLYRPGRRFHYSNVGFAVAGELVARLRGGTWWERLQQEVVAPLGLVDTTYHPREDAAPGLAVHPYADLLHDEPATDTLAMAPAGQLWSTVSDLALFAGFLARGDEKVLADELRLEMQVPAMINDEPGAGWSRSYGFGLDVLNLDGTRYIGHGGSMPGFQSALRIDPATGDGVVLLMNNTAGIDLPALSLVDLMHQQQPRVAPAWSAAPPSKPAEIGELAGTWFWGPRAHVLRIAHDGALELTPAGSGRGSRFRPTGPDTYLGTDEYFAGEILTVHRTAGHADHLDLGSFRFTRTPYDPQGDVPGGTGEGWR